MERFSTYTPKMLAKEARAAVRGLGTFVGYEIEIHQNGARLVARFIRHYNPMRPMHVQAVERTTVAI